MDKAIQSAKILTAEPEKNWMAYLQESDLHLIFRPIYKLDLSIIDANLLVAFIIYAYDPDSQKIDIRKERRDNKLRICESIELDIKNKTVASVLNNEHNTVSDVILEYLKELTDWRWQTIMSQLDYHSSMMRFVIQKTDTEKTTEKENKDGEKTKITEDYDLGKISSINKQKGELLKMAQEAREKADELLGQIKKDFMQTDVATQSDLGFTFTETAKKPVDIESWKEFRKKANAEKA